MDQTTCAWSGLRPIPGQDEHDCAEHGERAGLPSRELSSDRADACRRRALFIINIPVGNIQSMTFMSSGAQHTITGIGCGCEFRPTDVSWSKSTPVIPSIICNRHRLADSVGLERIRSRGPGRLIGGQHVQVSQMFRLRRSGDAAGCIVVGRGYSDTGRRRRPSWCGGQWSDRGETMGEAYR